jgi:hypothetical protein
MRVYDGNNVPWTHGPASAAAGALNQQAATTLNLWSITVVGMIHSREEYLIKSSD